MSTKRTMAATLARPVVQQSAKASVQTRIVEKRTAVTTGCPVTSQEKVETIEISSDSGSSNCDDVSDDTDVSDDEKVTRKRASFNVKRQSSQKTPPPEVTRLIKGAKDVDKEMLDGEQDGEASDAEPTLGDLLRGNSTTVDIAAPMFLQQATPLSPLSGMHPKQLPAPVSLSSLGITLNQALRTDDSNLLEACLQQSDHVMVMTTINRMDSALAGVLLSKLAARMHRRPGRALGLMRWIQGTMIAHGGALASQPDLMTRLGDLSRVLEERSRGLPSLLALKGKLDMLDAQLRMRNLNKELGASDHNRLSLGDASDAENGGGVGETMIYVENEESYGPGSSDRNKKGGVDEDDEFLLLNGGGQDSEDNSDEDGEELAERLVEDAESGGEDLDDDEVVDLDDLEESGDEESDEEVSASPPKKRLKGEDGMAKR